MTEYYEYARYAPLGVAIVLSALWGFRKPDRGYVSSARAGAVPPGVTARFLGSVLVPVAVSFVLVKVMAEDWPVAEAAAAAAAVSSAAAAGAIGGFGTRATAVAAVLYSLTASMYLMGVRN